MLRSLFSPFEVLLSAFSTRAGVALPEWPNWTIGNPLSLFATDTDSSADYPRAFALIPDIYSCVTLIQNRIAALPLKFYDAEGDEIERQTGNIADLWATANARDTGSMLIKQIVGSLELNGNGYVFLDFMGTSSVRELWCLTPTRVWPIPGPRMSVRAYKYDQGDGTYVTIPAEQIIHFRNYDPEHGLLGLSPLSAARLRYETQRDAAQWMRWVYRRGGLVSGQYSTEQILADQDIKRLQDSLEKRGGGVENAGRAMILPRGLQFVRSGLTSQELQFIESALLTSADIYKIFQIPPVIMGTKQGGGLSDAGATTDLLLFYENCIMPRSDAVATVINEVMLSGGAYGKGVTCKFDLSGVLPLQEVFLQQAKQLVEIAGGPIITRDEARKRIDLKEHPDPEEQALLEKIIIPNTVTVEGMVPKSQLDAVQAQLDQAKVTSVASGGQPVGAQNQGLGKDAPARRLGELIDDDERLRDIRRDASAHWLDVHEKHATGEFQRLMRGWGRRAMRNLNRALAGEKLASRLWTFADERERGPQIMLPGGDWIDVTDLLNIAGVDTALVRRLLRAIAEGAGTEAINALNVELAYNVRSLQMGKYIPARTQFVLDHQMQRNWDEMRKALGSVVEKGGGDDEMRAAIRSVFTQRTNSDAAMIARTETVAVYNRAQQDAWNQLNAHTPGAIVDKEWVSAHDERVREGHNEADGQRVPLGAPFNVRGTFNDRLEHLMYPGDSAGSPNNIINCRCVMRPIIDTQAATKAKAAPTHDDLADLLSPSTNGHAVRLNGKTTQILPASVAARMGVSR